MNRTSDYLARVLDRGTGALSAYAAADLLESCPEAGTGFGPDPLSVWQNWLAARLRELAAAIAAGELRIFVSQLQWAESLLAARGFSTKHIRTSLVCLRKVLASELPDTVVPLAVEYLERGLDQFHKEQARFPSRLGADTPESRLTAEYLLAIFQGERQRAKELVFDALDQGNSVQHLVTNVLLPSQVEVGRMWHADEINVAEEHFASDTTKKIMAQLMSRATFQPSNGKTMLAAGVAGNHVDIGLQAVADFFELDGWRTIQLGADVPIPDIVQAVVSFDADLLGLSASQSTQFEIVRETIDVVRRATPDGRVKIIVGGFAFTGSQDLAKRLGADGYASDAASAVQVGRALVFGTANESDGTSGTVADVSNA